MLQGPDDGWSCQADQATWTGQQGIKVLRRWPFLSCRDSPNVDQEQDNTVHTAAGVKVKLCLYSFTGVFGMGSSTAWGAWEGRRRNLLDGNLTFEHRLYLVLIFSTVHVRLFHGKSRSKRQAQRKSSLQEFNKVAKSLFLHFIMHMPWNYVLLEPDLSKQTFQVAHSCPHLSSTSAFGWCDTILSWQSVSALVWV